MSLRLRLTLVAAATVAVSVLLAAVVVYFVVQRVLMLQMEGDLTSRARSMQAATALSGVMQVPDGQSLPVAPITWRTLPQPPLGTPTYFKVVAPGPADREGVGTEQVAKVAAPAGNQAIGATPGSIREQWIDGAHVMTDTVSAGPDRTAMFAVSLDGVDQTLQTLRLVLLATVLAGVALSVLLGRLVATAALWPVQSLSAAVQHVTSTRDMSQRVEVYGDDELGRLAGGFNAMMRALEQSLQSQRQLVADASHELRTPLTSLRANVEVLARAADLPAARRRRLLGHLLTQIEQLTSLVQDLIDLARGDARADFEEELRLDELVAAAVERARAHWPQVRFAVELGPSVVAGDRARLDRAVSNLLDNAGKWSPPGGLVEVTVADGECTVRDHGPGIAPDDLAHVLDRFWRAPGARAMPGSGLGLAIVRQVAESCGGSVRLESPPGGGTQARLQLRGQPDPA